ncbi:hypothetical protein EIN_186350 [Entamoeba invadens IP1]|uniref:hypothetical protein n=1 Tax=Entamoeba invadens IP1 TaxID=370355 RepID=UPI0002C3F33B|nr:hypothetical protein EIN_186350 [Entamoeba invadens IP1]ELP94208.1 hypothetical protein EIN_186350 [Entamoeba invadens IP1]|eukprot:XP_004260979.1 hypothetical protein EIN_186350 [Entamoeba invadens IP1]
MNKQDKENIKLILVGDSGVGKTSIVSRYVNDTYNGKEQPTIGVDFLSRAVDIDGKTFHFAIWDTAGDEKYDSLTRLYYRFAAGVFIVFSINDTTSFSKVETWIERVLSVEKNAQLVIIGNKSDLRKEDPPTQQLVPIDQILNIGVKYECPVIEVSALTGENVPQMFQIMYETLAPKIDAGTFESEHKSDNVEISQQPAQQQKRCC